MPGRCGKGECGGWHGKLRNCGFRLTLPRQAVMEVLSKSSKHLSADEIFVDVHKRYPGIGLTSVYRTLELLAQMGVVVKMDFGDGRARFELTAGHGGKEHHHHLVCTSCGGVVDYTDFIAEEVELLKRTEKGLSAKFDFAITSHLIQFYGLCAKCKGK